MKTGSNYIDPTGSSTAEQLIYLNPHNKIEDRLAALKKHDELSDFFGGTYDTEMLADTVAYTQCELGSDFPTFSGPTK